MDCGPFANPGQASLALRRQLAAEPDNPGLRLALMELYRGLGRLEEAAVLGEAGLAAAPEDEDLRLHLGLVYAALGATEPLLALLRGRPGEGEAALAMGRHAGALDQWDTALAGLRRGLELRPGDGAGWLDLCTTLANDLRLDEVLDHTARLLAGTFLDDGVRAQLGLLRGTALLLLGRLEEGFPWLETRFAVAWGPRLDPLPLPVWRGEELAGRTLLVRSEQGFGDVFLMARYLKVLAERGARVYLTPQPGTQALLATCDGLEGLVEGQVTLSADALQAPILSLPMLCGTRLETIPASVPYLRVPARVPHREAIDACLDGAREPCRIGLVWAGNPAHKMDRLRNLPPELLEVLADVPGVTWVDLQVREGPRPALPMLDLARHLQDFADTAHALQRLDGLISVDSSPIHLAGALGRPAWLALPRFNHWPWLLDRSDSPWYPTVTLWRQPATGDWASVLQAMRARLLEANPFAGNDKILQ